MIKNDAPGPLSAGHHQQLKTNTIQNFILFHNCMKSYNME
ncbi:hypothetical protein M134_3906 [Bacteroides fragilis str. S24L34]|nr:hypothetical protein M134_3906 [Bacteroides fragilis str. S24L34]